MRENARALFRHADIVFGILLAVDKMVSMLKTGGHIFLLAMQVEGVHFIL